MNSLLLFCLSLFLLLLSPTHQPSAFNLPADSSPAALIECLEMPDSNPVCGTDAGSFDYVVEGLPPQRPEAHETPKIKQKKKKKKQQSYAMEIVWVSFFILFAVNFFKGKRENEKLALSWAAKFATKGSIFDNNFSLVGFGEGEGSRLLLKEGYDVFKFYASGRRYCKGILATMHLKSRHDLISRVLHMIPPCEDEITFKVYMNDDAMDHEVFVLAKRFLGWTMEMRDFKDLGRFAQYVTRPPPGRTNWVGQKLAVISSSSQLAGDLITDAVLDKVFGEKAFEKYEKGFIYMHFSDVFPGRHQKMLLFKFALPDANNMADMTRLVELIPYYIDLIGCYKLSSEDRSREEVIRQKVAQEALELERKKIMEETMAKLVEAMRKNEAMRKKGAKRAIREKEAKRGHGSDKERSDKEGDARLGFYVRESPFPFIS